MVMKKLQWGHLPPSCKDYVCLGQLGKYYEHQWNVWGENEENKKSWRCFRVMVSGNITGRANYTLSWNYEQNRFRAGHDLEDFCTKRPLLFKRFCDFMKEEGHIDANY